jgi:hypothetical protein
MRPEHEKFRQGEPANEKPRGSNRDRWIASAGFSSHNKSTWTIIGCSSSFGVLEFGD